MNKGHMGGRSGEAEHNGQNLAAGDILDISFNEHDSHTCNIEPCSLSTNALGLAKKFRVSDGNAGIIETITHIEKAITTLKTRQTVTEMMLSALQSRTRFTRDKIASLRGTSQFLTEQDKVYGAICEIASLRATREPEKIKPHMPEKLADDTILEKADAVAKPEGENMAFKPDLEPIAKKPETNDNIQLPLSQKKPQSLSTSPLSAPVRNSDEKPDQESTEKMNIPDDFHTLDTQAKDLVRFLDPTSYLTHWFKYEKGEKGTFTSFIAKAYSPELITRSGDQYINDKAFRAIADKYMNDFQGRIEQIDGDTSKRKAKIDKLLKTEHGTIYLILMKASEQV